VSCPQRPGSPTGATGTFQGEQYAIFCYNSELEGGFVDVDWFKFSDLLPAEASSKTKKDE